MDWREYAPICTMRLNCQVPQYGGFTHGKGVFGRAQKLPIGTFGNPRFKDPIYQNGATDIQTQNVLVNLRGSGICFT